MVITLTCAQRGLTRAAGCAGGAGRREGEVPLGTGPYVIDGDGESLWLAANPNWWQGRTPPYDFIPLFPCDTPEDWVSAFDGGQGDGR